MHAWIHTYIHTYMMQGVWTVYSTVLPLYSAAVCSIMGQIGPIPIPLYNQVRRIKGSLIKREHCIMYLNPESDSFCHLVVSENDLKIVQSVYYSQTSVDDHQRDCLCVATTLMNRHVYIPNSNSCIYKPCWVSPWSGHFKQVWLYSTLDPLEAVNGLEHDLFLFSCRISLYIHTGIWCFFCILVLGVIVYI